MNGSYSVPTGSSRSPLIECDRPSADSVMNRFISAMPSSMCWPFGENSQLKVEGMRSLLNVSAIACAREQAAAVDPGAEIGRDRDVRRGGDDALREVVVAAADLVEDGAEAGLRRHRRLDRDRQRLRHDDRAAPRAGAGPRRRTARGRGRPAAGLPRAAGPRTCPTRGLRARSAPCGRRPSAPASSARRGCPCGRPSAGRSPSPCSR